MDACPPLSHSHAGRAFLRLVGASTNEGCIDPLLSLAQRCADRERCNLDAYWSGKPNRQRERERDHTAARLAPLRPIVSHNLSYLSFSFFSRSPLPGQRAFLCLKFGSRSHKRRQGRSGNRFSSVWRDVGSYFLLTELSIFLS